MAAKRQNQLGIEGTDIPSHDDPLRKLREILLKEDQEAVDELRLELLRLQEQINDKDRLIETLDPILADLLDRKIHDSKDEMAEALSPLMGEAIRRQVQNAKEDVVDALYPVMGRMISKAIKEAMKNLVETINDRIDNTLNFKLWFKRMKAKLFGVDAAELIIAENAPFRISEMFLIERKSGLLISYLGSNGELEEKDAHVIGGMLTAIKSFAEDAFLDKKQAELQEIEYSDQTIRIEPGRYTYLAAVFNGVPEADFNAALQHCHHKIHNRFYNKLRDYHGDNAQFHGVDKIMMSLWKKYNV